MLLFFTILILTSDYVWHFRKKKQFSESSSTHSTAGCPTIISRSEWGARAPTHHNGRLPTTPGHVYIHHGATPGCHTKADCIQRVQSYQNYHMDSHGMKDIKLSNKNIFWSTKRIINKKICVCDNFITLNITGGSLWLHVGNVFFYFWNTQ